MPRHPIILLRRAQADPNDIRIRRINHFENGVFFPSIGRTPWRRMYSRDFQFREALLKLAREQISDAGCTAVKEMTMTGGRAALAEGQHQIRPVDPTGVAESMKPIEPDERHAVRRREAAPVDDRAQSWVVLALHHGVNGADVYIVSRA